MAFESSLMGSAESAIPESMCLPPGRVLGEDFAPPRTAYCVVIPALLAFVGVLSWVLGNDAGFVLSCMVAALIGFYTFWEWLFRKQPTRFSTLLAMGLLLGYGGGAVNTWITLPRGGLTLTTVMGLGPGVLARGIGAVLLAAAALYFVGEIYEKPVFGRGFRFTVNQRTRTLVYAGALAIVAGYATHAMGFEGVGTTGIHPSPIGTFLAWLYGPVTAIAVVAFLTAPSVKTKLCCGIAAIILLGLLAAMGRRAAIYTSVEILLAIELSGYRWRGSPMRKALIVAGLGAIIVFSSLSFMLLRIAGNRISHPQRATVARRIEVARGLMRRGDALKLAGSSTQQNLQTRTFVIAFFANVLDASIRKTPALGADAIMQIETAIPRVIYPGKDASFSEEQLIDQVFGFGYGDESNSILTAGATDFSLIGVIIYPLLLVGLFRLVFEIMDKFLGLVPMMFIALSLISGMIATEGTLSGYVNALRVTPFFGLAIALFMLLPVFKLRAE